MKSKSKSCICLSSRYSSDTEAPIPLEIGLTAEGTRTRPTVLERKGSTLQTSVQVFRCKFGKPAATPEGPGEFSPSKEWTPIHYAVYHQREAALSHFLRSGGSPDDVNGTGQPPLCIAVANGNIETVKMLMNAGADVNVAIKKGGETALHLAVKNGRSDLVDLITLYGPNLEAKTYETGDTPLHYAASKSGSLATVMTLLKLGAKYDALNIQSQTPAESALKANNIHGAVAIINAAHGKHNKLVKEKELLLKHVQKTQGGFSIGNDLIADIFSAACDPESTVLVEAIKRNDAGLVDMFLEQGSDPDRETAKGLRPIFVALECASVPVIQALIKHNADVTARDAKGLNLLQAAFEGSLAQEKEAMSAIFGALLEKGANPMVTYPDGKTLLHYSVSPELNHTKIAHLLISAGVNINGQDNNGNTALHLATHSKSSIEMLLKNGANPRLANLDVLTPLLYASTYGKKETEPDLESLIKVSDIRKTNHNNQTALHLAAANGLEKAVRLLLRARADTAVVDANKNTPLLLAVKNHQWSIVPLLTIPPSINSWDADGISALHHIASSIPKAPSTWKDIAAATASFCERSVSRSMRDRSGATPLIQAVRTLPEEGLPVVEALLVQKADRRASWNCASHEDHKKRDALYYAATMGKPVFVEALIKHGAVFSFEDWVPNRGQLEPSAETDKRSLKLFAQYEWIRRAGSLRRQSGGPYAEVSAFSRTFPIQDLRQMISMGLDVNALPWSPLGASMLWAVLRHIPIQPPMAPKYLLDTIKLILEAGAYPNAETTRGSRRSPSPQSTRASKESLPLSLHPLTFLLEEFPMVDIDLITLLLTKGTKISVASPFYGGRFPLHSAVKAKRIDIVDEFFLQNADVDCKDQSGRTPLFIATENGSWQIVDTLLRRGAKVDTNDCEKNTPLHAAAIGGSKKIVATLLLAGANADIKNAKGLTPLERAAEDQDAQEKNKTLPMLKDVKEKEKMGKIYLKKHDEQKNAYEVKMTQLKEDDLKARLRRKQDEQNRLQTEQPRYKEQEDTQKGENAGKSSPPPQPPLETKTSSSMFRNPSLFSSRPKSATPPPSPMPMPKPNQTSILSLHITTIPSAPQQRNHPTASRTSASMPQLPAAPISPQTNTAPIPHPLTSEKPLPVPAPRVDSVVGQRKVENPLLALTKNKKALDLQELNRRLSDPRISGYELADWVVMSRMLGDV
ncbi:ankyrin repeat domain-containing protein [Clathrospora elynae]|uniref:Ankyrin repeat domain-containing protein n=1 Tax=Clathrospora elynae TaxID=706981 RepID=A0A6A5T1D4_9PLEO|nr:ankyrin repeat domain-containing protein [Clathrospora elynae]